MFAEKLATMLLKSLGYLVWWSVWMVRHRKNGAPDWQAQLGDHGVVEWSCCRQWTCQKPCLLQLLSPVPPHIHGQSCVWKHTICKSKMRCYFTWEKSKKPPGLLTNNKWLLCLPFGLWHSKLIIIKPHISSLGGSWCSFHTCCISLTSATQVKILTDGSLETLQPRKKPHQKSDFPSQKAHKHNCGHPGERGKKSKSPKPKNNSFHTTTIFNMNPPPQKPTSHQWPTWVPNARRQHPSSDHTEKCKILQHSLKCVKPQVPTQEDSSFLPLGLFIKAEGHHMIMPPIKKAARNIFQQ